MGKSIFGIFVVTCFFNLAPAADEKERHRLEDLFIWKISEELKLSVNDEKWLGTTIKAIGQEKTDLQKQMDSLAQSLKTNPEKLVAFKKSQQKLHDLQISEINQIEKKLGQKRAALYVYYRNELYKRVLNIIDASEKPKIPEKKLPPPRVVEE